VTVAGDRVTFSALEEDEDGDRKIWVPIADSGAIIGVQQDESVHFAMVFADLTQELRQQIQQEIEVVIKQLYDDTSTLPRCDELLQEITISDFPEANFEYSEQIFRLNPIDFSTQ